MKLIKIKSQNFERVNTVEDSCIFNDELWTLNGEHRLQLKDNVKPSIMGCRRTPVSLRPLLKKELERLVNKGVIAPVEEPTEWISQAVITPKKDGQVRLCIDPQELNKALKREHFTLPTLDDNLHELRDAKVFSKADLAAGYWHIKLEEESSKLRTF